MDDFEHMKVQLGEVGNLLSKNEDRIMELLDEGGEYGDFYSSCLGLLLDSIRDSDIGTASSCIMFIFGLGYYLGKEDGINLDPDIWGDALDE